MFLHRHLLLQIQQERNAEIEGFLISAGIMITLVAVLGLIGAVLVRAAAKWVVKIDVPFKVAYGSTVVVYILGSVEGFLLQQAGRIVLAGSPWELILPGALGAPINLVIAGWIFGAAIRLPDTGAPIGFARGILVTLAYVLLGLALALVIVPITLILMKFYGIRAL